MKKQKNDARKICSQSSIETNRSLRSRDRKFLGFALFLILLLSICVWCLLKDSYQKVFINCIYCFLCLALWSVILYLRKWTNSEIVYYFFGLVTFCLLLILTRNLFSVIRVVLNGIPFAYSCVEFIHNIEKFLEEFPCPETLEVIFGLTGIIAYVCYASKQQYSIPKDEWNYYTCWVMHSQRLYYLFCETVCICGICYVIVERYGYIRVIAVCISGLFLLMFFLQTSKNRYISRNEILVTENICRYLFEQANLSFRYPEIRNGTQCTDIVKIIASFAKQNSEHHTAIMTVICFFARMVQQHLHRVHDKNCKPISEGDRKKEIAIYSFAIGVASAMINSQFNEQQYKEVYEQRWRILYKEHEKQGMPSRDDMLLGFACGVCLSIVTNLDNGSVPENQIHERIKDAEQMMKTVKKRNVFLQGLQAELYNRGESKKTKETFAFLQHEAMRANAIVMGKYWVKEIFDTAIHGETEKGGIIK